MDPLRLAQQHQAKVVELAESGLIAWTEVKMPKPEASRGFNGIAKTEAGTVQYIIMVVQANVVEAGGVVHEGMVMVADKQGAMAIHMDPEIADKLYHKAATQRN